MYPYTIDLPLHIINNKVVGKVKNFQGRKTLDVLNIKAVESMDEVTHHLLTAIHTHLALTRPKPVVLILTIVQIELQSRIICRIIWIE
jgi:hypothetical protein